MAVNLRCFQMFARKNNSKFDGILKKTQSILLRLVWWKMNKLDLKDQIGWERREEKMLLNKIGGSNQKLVHHRLREASLYLHLVSSFNALDSVALLHTNNKILFLLSRIQSSQIGDQQYSNTSSYQGCEFFLLQQSIVCYKEDMWCINPEHFK